MLSYIHIKLTKKTKKKLIKYLSLAAVSLGVVVLAIFLPLIMQAGSIAPNTSIAGIDVGGLSVNEATFILGRATQEPSTISLRYGEQIFKISTKSLGVQYDFVASSQRAYHYTRTGNPIVDTKRAYEALLGQKKFGFVVNLNESILRDKIAVIASEIETPVINPSASLSELGIEIFPGAKGVLVNTQKMRAKIANTIALNLSGEITVDATVVDPTISDIKTDTMERRAEKLVGKSITIMLGADATSPEEDTENPDIKTYVVDDSELISLLSSPKYNEEKLVSLITDIKEVFERDPQNALFEFQEGRVQEFLSSKNGVRIESNTKKKLSEALVQLETSDAESATVRLSAEITEPEIKTEDVNNLGINQLIGKGTSRFRGSIASRIHNIGVASSRFQGVLIKPGEIFSFNKYLGDVSQYTGYKQAYIISGGRTVLGDGGGVCQVSTTMFRAALDAGLPIVERNPHSYRVTYYEQDSSPGYDATVYSPSVDLKFRNDTPGHLLVQTFFDPFDASLIFEIYGTDDGRIATLTKPEVISSTPPPEPLYQDDPTKPVGTTEQIDWAAWGAKVSFDYTVERDGKKIYEKTFYSNYKPWQAVYLVGTAI